MYCLLYSNDKVKIEKIPRYAQNDRYYNLFV